MIQVDQTRTCRVYVAISDANRKAKTVHETVYGITPAEALAIFRDALIAETRRRIAQQQQAAVA